MRCSRRLSHAHSDDFGARQPARGARRRRRGRSERPCRRARVRARDARQQRHRLHAPRRSEAAEARHDGTRRRRRAHRCRARRAPIPKDAIYPYVAAFTASLQRSWSEDRPDVVHSHFWMSGLAALGAAKPLGIPVAHTFHALGVEKRRHQGRADTSPDARIAEEARIVRAADRIVATASAEVFELLRMGASPRSIKIVPCGVDLERFTPAGPSERTNGDAPAGRDAVASRAAQGHRRRHRGDRRRAERRTDHRRRRRGARSRDRSGSTASLAARTHARRRRTRLPARPCRARRGSRAAPLGRHRRMHAVVRALRHRAARSDGVRRSRRRRRPSAGSSTRSSTASRACTCRLVRRARSRTR